MSFSSLLIVVIFFVDSLNAQCNENIVNAILNTTSAQPNSPIQILQGSTYIFVSISNNNTTIQTVLNQGGCVTVTAIPNGLNCSSDRQFALHTLYYNRPDQSTYGSVTQNNTIFELYQEQAIGRGLNLQTDSQGFTSLILILDTSPVVCYYRCNIDGESLTYAAAAVPVGTAQTVHTKKAIKRCKNRLREVGAGDLVDVPRCRPPCTK